MKKKLRFCFMIFALFVAYLLIGSFIFGLIEKENEQEVTLDLANDVIAFLNEHECVDQQDLNDLFGRIHMQFREGSYRILFTNKTEDFTTTWDTLSGIFFCFTIVTTIGFGHITPKTVNGQVFCIIYASLGIPITGYLLSLLADIFERFWKWYMNKFSKRLKCIHSIRVRRGVIITLGTISVLLVTVFLPSWYWSKEEDWPYWTSLYYTFITMTTIGFGDYVANVAAHEIELFNRILDLVITVFTILLTLGIFTGILKMTSKRIQSKSIGTTRLSTMVKRLIGDETMNRNDLKINTISREVAQNEINDTQITKQHVVSEKEYEINDTQITKQHVVSEKEYEITTTNHLNDRQYTNDEHSLKLGLSLHEEHSSHQQTDEEATKMTNSSCEDASSNTSDNRLDLVINNQLIISRNDLSDEMITNIKYIVNNYILEKNDGRNDSRPRPITTCGFVESGTLNNGFADDVFTEYEDRQNTHILVDMHTDTITR